ncbi:archaeosortase/exosortase family protein [Patescibacteria group bacterium]|nr:archaeosortase/exosortase family protein [Patescibacteria group bacterium]
MRNNELMLKSAFHSFKKFYAGPMGFVVDVALFAIITYGFHELWWEFARVIKSYTVINVTADWLAEQVFHSSLWINRNILGLHVTTEYPNYMWFSNGGYVQVVESCSGLKQFYQILVLFVLFPGPWKHKLWFIPMSIVIMHGVNILRIVILSAVVLWRPDYWDFIHDWVLRPGFYVVIFGLWVVWVERFRSESLKVEGLEV